MSVMGEGGVEEEYDDDAYYLELRRRILLLMVDDEDDDGLELERNYGHCWNMCSSGFPMAIRHPETTQFEDGLVCARSRWESEKTRSYEAPSWMVNLWRNGNGSGTGNGTGVFIPQVVKPTRRQRPGRKMKSSGRRIHQQVSREGL